MKKEQFFRLLGELDDQVLEQYRQMDAQLSKKMLRKKRTWRVVIIAACLVLLIGACVPVGMMIAQFENDPATPPRSINLESLEELEIMREMIACEDEQALYEYLHSIPGGGAQSRQDLIDFVNLVEHTPYACLIDGKITWLNYKGSSDKQNEVLYVTVKAPNGEWVRCGYLFSVENVSKQMNKVKREIGRDNCLSSPLSTGDGRLTLYTETREPHPTYEGDLIEWWGVLDGIVVEIAYYVADMDAVDTVALLNSLNIVDTVVLLESLDIDDSVSPVYPEYAWSNTEFGAFVQETPAMLVYSFADIPGSAFSGQISVDVFAHRYQDSSAPATITFEHQGEEYVLSYDYSETMAWRSIQAMHVYRSQEKRGMEVAIDQKTGECIEFSAGVPVYSDEEALPNDRLEEIAYAFLAEKVRDPKEYRLIKTNEISGEVSFTFSRYVGDYPSADGITLSLNMQGEIQSYYLRFLGAMRNADEIPDALIQRVMNAMRRYMGANDSCGIEKVILTPDGRLALDCWVEIENGGDGASMLFVLTEPLEVETLPDDPMQDHLSAWSDTEFGAFLQSPEFHIYSTSHEYDKAPQFAGMQDDIDLIIREYRDSDAPATAVVTFGGETVELNYRCSRTHGQDGEYNLCAMVQAVHSYELQSGARTYTAWIDQVTGACVFFSVEDVSASGVGVNINRAIEIAEEYLKTLVEDSEQYQVISSGSSKTAYKVEFSRCVSGYETCDTVTVWVDRQTGKVKSYMITFYGAMQGVEQVPKYLTDAIVQTMCEISPRDDDYYDGYYGRIRGLTITENGRLAMDCYIMADAEGYQKQIGVLFYLTEPIQ